MEYEIEGGAFPMVVCTLNKGETIKEENGAMSFMTPNIEMNTNTGGGLLKGLKRSLSGDSLFLTFFTANKDGEKVGFSSSYPGKILPFKLDGSKALIAEKSSFLAAEEGVDIDMHFRKKLGTGLFSGEGFVLQKLSGNGTVFLEIDGEVIEHNLKAGEKILVDYGHLAAMEDSVEFDIQRIKGVKNILFGEGLFLSTLTGPGKVWVQTMPISKLAKAIIPYLPVNSGND